jgi:hypothetical protein
MAYIFLYLLNSLPWATADFDELECDAFIALDAGDGAPVGRLLRMVEEKKDQLLHQSLPKMPCGALALLDYCKQLTFEEMPDYSVVRRLASSSPPTRTSRTGKQKGERI